jgi:hypothetical protein
MRVHHFFVVATVVAVVALLPAASGFARSAAPAMNDPVSITNKACHLDYPSVSGNYSAVVFGVTNNGSVAHGFDISGRYKSGLIKPGQEKTIVAHFGHGSYRYACVAAHSTVKKGVFTIR